MAAKISANSQKGSGKRRGRVENLKPWPKGVSGNPKGAPKRGESWSEIIKVIGNLTPTAAAEWAAAIAKRLKPIGDRVTLREAALISAFAGTIFDPQASILNFLADHEEGRVPTRPITLTDWREQAKAAGISPSAEFERLVQQAVMDNGGTLGDTGSREPNSD